MTDLMHTQSAPSAYREAFYESAPPIKIIHLMYEGAMRFLDQAQHLDPARNAAEFTEKLGRAGAIVSELRLSLEAAHAPELVERLNSLYLFVEDRIRNALLERTAESIAAARAVLETLLDGWKRVELDSQAETSSAS